MTVFISARTTQTMRSPRRPLRNWVMIDILIDLPKHLQMCFVRFLGGDGRKGSMSVSNFHKTSQLCPDMLTVLVLSAPISGRKCAEDPRENVNTKK